MHSSNYGNQQSVNGGPRGGNPQATNTTTTGAATAVATTAADDRCGTGQDGGDDSDRARKAYNGGATNRQEEPRLRSGAGMQVRVTTPSPWNSKAAVARQPGLSGLRNAPAAATQRHSQCRKDTDSDGLFATNPSPITRRITATRHGGRQSFSSDRPPCVETLPNTHFIREIRRFTPLPRHS